MKRVLRHQFTYRLARDVPPVLAIDPGETIELETFDSSTGRIKRPEDVHSYVRVLDRGKVNPAAGPVYVNGAEPGDTLVVDILSIQLDAVGSSRIIAEDVGVLASMMQRPFAHMVRIEGQTVIFDSNISFPARPMVGVIGTAPAEGEVFTGLPGESGGNLDHNDISLGARVYLPVNVGGALFALGDLHASMGDGEVSGGGVEISGCTTIRVDLMKGRRWPRPWIQTAADWITTAGAGTLEMAIKTAVRDMVDLLMEKLGLSAEQAYVLTGARGDVRIGQACGGLPVTVRVRFPRLGR